MCVCVYVSECVCVCMCVGGCVSGCGVRRGGGGGEGRSGKNMKVYCVLNQV